MLGQFGLGLGPLDSEPWHTFQHLLIIVVHSTVLVNISICHRRLISCPKQQQKDVKLITWLQICLVRTCIIFFYIHTKQLCYCVIYWNLVIRLVELRRVLIGMMLLMPAWLVNGLSNSIQKQFYSLTNPRPIVSISPTTDNKNIDII